jgi:hypothetical protein
LVIGHWSSVIGHWSLVIGHLSLVIGHLLLVIDINILTDGAIALAIAYHSANN